MAATVCEEYASSLNDLTFNSKPHISMLTMLAEENVQYAPQIVQVIEAHLQKVKPEAKLPAIYLIDSIVKNVGDTYQSLFTQNLVSTFCNVFEKVDEKTRIQLFKLRQTWSEVFPNKKLYAIDVRVNQMDPAWPITAQATNIQNIYVNPKFLKNPAEEDRKNYSDVQESEMRKQLIAKQQELLKIQQQKLELELYQAKAKLEEQKRLLEHQQQDKEKDPIVSNSKTQEIPVEAAKKIKSEIAPVVTPILRHPVPTESVGQTPRVLSAVTKVIGKDPRMARDPRLHTRAVPHVNPSPVNPTVAAVNVVNANKISNTLIPNNKLEKIVKDKIEPEKESNLSKITLHSKEKPVLNQTLKSVDKKKVDKKDKKKSETPLSKKGENKKDDKNDKHKSFTNDKKIKSKSEKSNTEIQRGRKSDKPSGRNSGKKVEHRKPNCPYRSSFRNQRNYRTNRDRSESPESKFENKMQKTEEKEQEKDKLNEPEKKSGGRGRSRSPVRSDRNNEKEDKRVDKADRKVLEKDKIENRKKSPRKEMDKNKAENVDEKELSNENKSNCKELSTTDIDLRVPQANSSKINTQDSSNPEKDDSSPVDEPPSKKMKKDDEDASLDDLFGTKDQDYRQLPPSNGLLSRSPGQGGWAQYKTDHPDKFRNAMTPLKENNRGYCSFGNFDQDFRKRPQSNEYDENQMEGRKKFARMPSDGRDPRLCRSTDPRIIRTFGKSYNKLLDDPQVLRRHPRYQRFQREMKNIEDELNIPHALNLNREQEILKQADQQLKSGHLTEEQHAEFLNQLSTLYELQRLKRQQREDQFRERFFKKEFDQQPYMQRHYMDYPEERSYDKNFPSVPYNSRFNKGKFDDDSMRRDMEFERNEQDKMTSSSNTHRDDEQYSQSTSQNVEERSLHESGNIHEALPTKSNSSKDTKMLTEKYIEAKSDHNRSDMLRNSKMENTIQIDGKLMSLKYFQSRAVVLDRNFAKEIYFKSGSRDVTIDELIVTLAFGDEKTFEIDGASHSIKLGVPRRELYIDDIPHEIRFGGPPREIKLNNKLHQVRISGPPPDVELKELDDHLKNELMKDEERNNAAGMNSEKINPEDNETLASRIPVSNSMEIADGQINTVSVASNENKNIDSREYSPSRQDDRDYRPNYGYKEDARYQDDLIQRDPHYSREEWNDRWKEEMYEGDIHHGDRIDNSEPKMRNSPLREEPVPEYWPRRPMYRERGVRQPNPQRAIGDYGPRHEGPPPRELPYRDYMHRYRPGPGPRIRYEGHPPPGYEGMRPRFDPMRPRFDGMMMRPRMDRGGHIRGPVFYSPNNPEFHHGTYPQRPPEYYGPRDRPVAPVQPLVSESATITEQRAVPASLTPPQIVTQPAAQTLDISELFQKLVSAGIIPSSSQSSSQDTDASSEANKGKTETEDKDDGKDYKIPPLEFTSECLKTHYAGVIRQLYHGTPCTSCGLRFKEEQNEKMNQHLDWHFRHNRRERESAKKAVSRKWYYDVQDWIQFEEIEDLEDRARSLFELQAVEDQTEQAYLPSVPVGEEEEDNFCIVCREPFEQFWDEEKEEWHLRDAVRVEDKTYHPACYEDIRNASMQESSAEEVEGEKEEDKSETSIPIKSEKLDNESPMEVDQPDTSNTALEGGIAVKEESEEITTKIDEIKDEVKESENEQPDESEKEIKIEPSCELDTPNEQSVQELEKNVEKLSVEAILDNARLHSMDLMQISNVTVKTEPVEQVSDSSANLVSVKEPTTDDLLVNIKEEVDIDSETPLCSQIIDTGSVEKGEFQCKSDVKHIVDKLNVSQELIPDLNVSQVDTVTPIKIENTGITEMSANKDIVSMSDSRFTVLPPVQRGTELSGLCTVL